MTDGAELLLSKSSMDTYLRCRYQWLLSYVHRLPSPPNLDMIVGTAVHAGAEAHWKGQDGEHAVIETLRWDLVAPGRFGKDEEQEAVNDAIRMWRTYLDRIAPTFTPTLIEEPFVIRLNGVLLSGVIDAADEDVHDTKTTTTPSKVRPEDHRLQLSLYRHGYRALTGKWPRRLLLDVVARNGRWAIKEVEPDDQELADVVGLTHDGIMRGAFEPTGVLTNACVSCPYWRGACTYGRVD